MEHEISLLCSQKAAIGHILNQMGPVRAFNKPLS
jgi:hypothetical protein